jgi:ribosomal protein S19E (S16A)
MKNLKKIKKTSSKVSTETAYLTKRDVIRVASAAVKRASVKAMQTAGYVIKAENGWVVRENEDGSIDRIKEIKGASSPNKLVLD